MSAPNTEREYVRTTIGGNQAGIVLNGTTPGTVDPSSSVAFTAGIPAVVVTGTPGTISLDVMGDLEVEGAVVTASPVKLASYLKTALPSATVAGKVIYVSNAVGAHVTGSVAFSNGTSWIDVTTGIAVA